MNWRITDPDHLLGAMRVSLSQGGQFLVGRIAPYGPILRERNVSYIHKASWGMYAAGVDHGTIARLLDWAGEVALQPNGDFYFPEERREYQEYQRVYRPLTFGKVAAWIDHPLIRKQQVLDRILQYQHQASGGCFHFIGNDPQHVEEQATIGTLNTTFFGHLMIALDLQEQARATGRWLLDWTRANGEPMADGKLYTRMTPAGKLVTDIQPGEKISSLVDTCDPQQEFWQGGTVMAYLALLYDILRSKWGESASKAQPYLDAAIELLGFEARMPLDTYLWPSKCKACWGAGELLRVLVKYQPEDVTTIEQAYRVGERVAVFTFMDNQLPHGGWSCMHYPLSEQAPELAFSYKPLKNTVRVPTHRIDDSQTIFLPQEEITGEFLGELKAFEQGVAAWLAPSSKKGSGVDIG